MIPATNSVYTNNNVIEELKQRLSCPLSYELLTDPVIDPCGHTFEKSYIVGWLNINPICPLSKHPLSLANLVPNRVAQDAAELLSRLEQQIPLAERAQPANLNPQDRATLTTAREILRTLGERVRECKGRCC
jgi:hypothetical protein